MKEFKTCLRQCIFLFILGTSELPKEK